MNKIYNYKKTDKGVPVFLAKNDEYLKIVELRNGGYFAVESRDKTRCLFTDENGDNGKVVLEAEFAFPEKCAPVFKSGEMLFLFYGEYGETPMIKITERKDGSVDFEAVVGGEYVFENVKPV